MKQQKKRKLHGQRSDTERAQLHAQTQPVTIEELDRQPCPVTAEIARRYLILMLMRDDNGFKDVKIPRAAPERQAALRECIERKPGRVSWRRGEAEA